MYVLSALALICLIGLSSAQFLPPSLTEIVDTLGNSTVVFTNSTDAQSFANNVTQITQSILTAANNSNFQITPFYTIVQGPTNDTYDLVFSNGNVTATFENLTNATLSSLGQEYQNLSQIAINEPNVSDFTQILHNNSQKLQLIALLNNFLDNSNLLNNSLNGNQIWVNLLNGFNSDIGNVVNNSGNPNIQITNNTVVLPPVNTTLPLNATSGVGEAVNQTETLVGNATNNVTSGIGQTMNQTEALVGNTTNNVTSGMGQAVNQTVSTAVNNTTTGIGQAVNQTVSNAESNATSLVNGLGNQAENTTTSLIHGLD